MIKKDKYNKYISQKFNSLLIKEIYYEKRSYKAKCLCDCGNMTVSSNLLKVIHGVIKTCKNCSNKLNGIKGRNSMLKNSKYNKYIGTTINYFTVLKRSEEFPGKFVCQCCCGNIRLKDAYSLRTGDVKSCGCKHSELLSLASGGTGIPNSSISINEYIRKNTKEYFEWQQLCLKQSDYTCNISNIRGTVLNVHHLIPLNKLISKYKITIINYKMYSDVLFDVSNGVVLSETIHRQFHLKYGHNTTPRQYKIFKMKFKAT